MTDTDTLLQALTRARIGVKHKDRWEPLSINDLEVFKKVLAARGLQIIAWRPIIEAPRDGSQFLFNAPDLECGYSVGYFEDGKLMLALDGSRVGRDVTKPTHFALIELPALIVVEED